MNTIDARGIVGVAVAVINTAYNVLGRQLHSLAMTAD